MADADHFDPRAHAPVTNKDVRVGLIHPTNRLVPRKRKQRELVGVAGH
jgi:hypothetical protein